MFDKLVDVLLQFINLFKLWVIITDWEMGIIMRLGKFNRMAPPGFHWRLPFGIENTYYSNTNMMTRIVGPQSLTTRDDVSVIISVVITEQIEDVKRNWVLLKELKKGLVYISLYKNPRYN